MARFSSSSSSSCKGVSNVRYGGMLAVVRLRWEVAVGVHSSSGTRDEEEGGEGGNDEANDGPSAGNVEGVLGAAQGRVGRISARPFPCVGRVG